MYTEQGKKRLHCSVYSRQQKVFGEKFQTLKDFVGSYLAEWSATNKSGGPF